MFKVGDWVWGNWGGDSGEDRDGPFQIVKIRKSVQVYLKDHPKEGLEDWAHIGNLTSADEYMNQQTLKKALGIDE